MPDRKVSSWNELTDVLFENSFIEELQRYRSNYAFRGLADAQWDLQTSLMRLGGAYALLENPILRSFRKYAHRDSAGGDSLWNWLTLAQHHGLPTRLLDWTYSPYVAMHFATAEIRHKGVDAAIWCVDFTKVKEYLPRKLQDVLRQEYIQSFTVEMLGKLATSLDEFDRLSKQDFVLFFEPPSLDDRVVNQYALFSVMSNPKGLLNDWLREHPDIFFRIILPSKMKWEIRDKLDQININERTMFPGLDGLSSWLKRHYSPGPRGEQPVTQTAGPGADLRRVTGEARARSVLAPRKLRR